MDDGGDGAHDGNRDALLAELRGRLDRAEHEAMELRQQTGDLRVELAKAQAEREAARAVAIADVATAQAEVTAKDELIAELKMLLSEARRPWWRRWIG
jgi:hypothetical protein